MHLGNTREKIFEKCVKHWERILYTQLYMSIFVTTYFSSNNLVPESTTQLCQLCLIVGMNSSHIHIVCTTVDLDYIATVTPILNRKPLE